MSSTSTQSPAPAAAEPTRRDFLYLATAAFGGVGAAATLWPLIDQMNPDAATQAAAGPVDIDVSQIQPGQQVVVLWSARPVFVVNRPKAALDALYDPAPPYHFPNGKTLRVGENPSGSNFDIGSIAQV